MGPTGSRSITTQSLRLLTDSQLISSRRSHTIVRLFSSPTVERVADGILYVQRTVSGLSPLTSSVCSVHCGHGDSAPDDAYVINQSLPAPQLIHASGGHTDRRAWQCPGEWCEEERRGVTRGRQQHKSFADIYIVARDYHQVNGPGFLLNIGSWRKYSAQLYYYAARKRFNDS